MSPRFGLAALMVGFCLHIHAGEAGAAYNKTVHFKLDESGDGQWRLHSETNVALQLQERPSVLTSVVQIPESFFAPLQSLTGWVDGRPLAGTYISHFTPQWEDIFLSDTKIHQLDFSAQARKGSKISYRYENRYLDTAFLPVIRVPNVDHGLDFTVIIDHPERVRADFAFHFPWGEMPYEVTYPNSTRTELSFQNLGYRKALPHHPFNEAMAYVMPRLWDGATSICKSSPESFNTWYGELLAELAPLSGENRALARALVAGSAMPREQLQALNDHVKRRIRYMAEAVAINAIVPRPPDRVLKREYGDCKDRALLIRELARELGFDVRMALVSTEHQPPLDGVKVSQFNHVICAWRDEREWVFFDPTQRDYPFAMLPETLEGKTAFILGEDGGELVRIPHRESMPGVAVSLVAETGSLDRCSGRITLNGDLAIWAQRLEREMTPLDRENALTSLVSGFFRQITFDYFNPLIQTRDRITYAVRVDLSKFAIGTSRNLYLPMTPFRVLGPDLLKREEDDLPVYLDDQPSMLLEIELRHPGYTLKTRSLALGGEEASFGAATTGETGQVTKIRYSFALGRVRYDVSQRTTLLDLARGYEGLRKEMFIFPNIKK